MLTIYRRHIRKCTHRSDGRGYRRCHCPIWVDGFLGGREIRQSLKLRNWQKANKTIQAWEAVGAIEEAKKDEPTTLQHAWDEFECDAKARELRESTLRKYSYLRNDMQRFADAKGLRFVNEFSVKELREWRAAWPNRNVSALKKLELVRCFLRFAHDSAWITDNPGRKLKSPKVRVRQTLPFTREEMIKILAALENYSSGRNRRRMRALVLLLRHSGLRIGDAVTLAKERINGDKLFLYTSKAGTPVYVPLPPFVVTALEAASDANGLFYFWTGNGKTKTAISDWQAKLKKLFELGKVKSAHAHRFRDTFATELLLANVPLERVSILLGHSSIRITEKHYAPWVRSRQEQLEADVRSTWNLPESKTKGTRRVHGIRAYATN